MIALIRLPISIALVSLCCLNCEAANPFTTKAERTKFIAEKTTYINKVFSQKPDSSNLKEYLGAFWASELMLLKTDVDRTNLKWALARFAVYPDNFKRALIQHCFTLYPIEFVTELDSLVKIELDEKRFAMMANYLIRQNSNSGKDYLQWMKSRFPYWQQHPILKAFEIEHTNFEKLSSKQIADLIAFRSQSGEASLFVFVNKNRDIPGFAIIQDTRGKIMVKNGDTVKIRLLARSITNMASYLTNGNTPQGVLSIQGMAQSDNVFIGSTPTLISTLPYEVSPTTFSFGKQKESSWSLEIYNRFFPESWASYVAKNMAFYAGEAGRSEVIVHGTTIDTDYYINQSYFPFTPSLGCVCTLEQWDENGKLIESQQQKLVKVLTENKIEKALMYIIEQ